MACCKIWLLVTSLTLLLPGSPPSLPSSHSGLQHFTLIPTPGTLHLLFPLPGAFPPLPPTPPYPQIISCLAHFQLKHHIGKRGVFADFHPTVKSANSCPSGDLVWSFFTARSTIPNTMPGTWLTCDKN